MKKIIGLAIMIAGSSAFASKARMNSLQNSFHLTDTETVFAVPSDMMLVPESMNFNFGVAAPAAPGDMGSGGMIKALGDARLGFFVGAVDATRTGYLGIENPFSIAYSAKAGEMAWGLLFSYSNSDKKATAASDLDNQTQSFMKLTGSVVMGPTTVAVDLGLADKAKGAGTLVAGNEDFEYSKAPVEVIVLHEMGEWTVYGDYEMSTVKDSSSGTEVKTDTTDLKIGAVHAMKKEGAELFYGFAYQMVNQKVGSAKTDMTAMPVIMGIEADAASWLTLRGSVSQNVLLGGTKTPTNGMDTPAHDTTVAAGAGLKFDKSVLDFTLTAAGSGNLNSNIGANAGLTYLF